jgi:predicted extracellular nuclease
MSFVRSLRPVAAILFFAIAPAIAAPKILINEVHKGGDFSASGNEWVELVVVETLTDTELETFFVGDSSGQLVDKFSAYRFTNMESFATTFPAGTIIVVSGSGTTATPPAPALDMTYSPGTGDWNLVLRAGSANLPVGGDGAGNFANNDVAYVDINGSGTNATIDPSGFGLAWGTNQSGSFDEAANLRIATIADGSGAMLTTDLAGAATPANWSILTNASLTPGQPNGGTNTTYINGLRSPVPAPSLSIAATSADKAEGDANTTPFTFTVTRSNSLTGTLSASYSVTGSGASPADAADFDGGTFPSGTVNFADSESTQVITVNVAGDTTFEQAEGFTVTLSNPSSGTISTATADGNIQNDDAAPPTPTISINAPSVAEAAGPLTFRVSLSQTSVSNVTFNYATGTGTASAGSDYTAIGATAGQINAGDLFIDIPVTLVDDAVVESNETVVLDITGVANANPASVSGTGTITNDDVPPNLSLADVTQPEGNSGTSTLAITATLDADPGAATVTFTLATSDDSATDADNDYEPATANCSLTGTNRSCVLNVTVNGDLSAEPDERFVVNASNVLGAVVVDGSAFGNIINDDRFLIWQIQGNGAFSPFTSGATLGSQTFSATDVAVRASVVTAVAYRATDNLQQGFFIQTPDAQSDGNAATSDGLYVFSTTAVSVGDLVEVSGPVKEHFGMTEMAATSTPPVRPVTVTVVGTGQSLPTAVEFSAASNRPSTNVAALSCPGSGPGGANNIDTNFECYEGMLVSVPQGVSLQGNFRRANDTYAELQFSPRATRSVREAGLRFPQAPGAGNAAAGTWDGNPEVLEMDPDIARRGATGPTPGIDTQIVGGATFSATGPLIFDFGDYVFWPTTLNVATASNVLPRPVAAPLSASELTVGSFNMQHLCDGDAPGDDGCVRDTPDYPGVFPAPTPYDYAGKLARVSAYVREVLRSPDVLGAQEVDEQSTLQDLANRIQADGGPAYTAYLVDGNDPGGIDVGYLVRNDRLSDVVVTQFFKANTWPDPNGTDVLHDRPPLLLRANFRSTPTARPFPIALLNNHTKARTQVDGSGAAAERDRAKRFWQGREIAQLVQEFQTATGAFAGAGTDNIPLILVGDYNAYQFTDGRVDVVGLVAGTYDDDANECNAVLSGGAGTETCNLGPNVVVPPLQNLVLSSDPNNRYSYLFSENLGTVLGYGNPSPQRDVVNGGVIDHILANAKAEPYASGIDFGRANHDMSAQAALTDNLSPDGAGGTQVSLALRSSDHDGLVASFETNCANLPDNPQIDVDNDNVCTLIDNCPAVANSSQADLDNDGIGDACDPENGPAIANDDGSLAAPLVLAEDAVGGLDIDVLANDIADPDTGIKTLDPTAVTGPANGSLEFSAGGVKYTPNPDTCGPDQFVYSINSNADTATVFLSVTCVNDAPTISAIADFSANENTAGQASFVIADVDSTLACSATNLSATSSNGTLLPVGNITFNGSPSSCTATLTPAAAQTGFSDVTITVDDGSGTATATASEPFRFTVIENDADNDGVPDATDNCPNTINPDQADADNDGTGDVCDAKPNDPVRIFRNGFED